LKSKEEERHGMTFMAISSVKNLNGLQNQFPLSCDQYEKMGNLASVGKRKVKDSD
jgi:hypothetical protein